MKRICIGSLIFIATCLLQADPPRFLAPNPQKEQEKTVEELLPIPPQATEEQKALYEAAIEGARQQDVSVTPQAALLYKGLGHLQDEEYEDAVPYLEETLRLDPSQQAGWEGLGWAYIKTDQFARAKALWEYFQRLMPDQALPYALLGQIAIMEQEWPLADKHFSKSLSIDPDQFDVRYWYGQNLMRLGKAEEAEDIFRELIKREPDRLDIQMDLASLLIQRLEYMEAVEIYRKVNDELPDNPRFMVEQALLELRVGELRRADELCLQALELDEKNLDAMSLRADIAELAGLHDITPLQNLIEETKNPVKRAALRIRLANRCIFENRNKPKQYDPDMILSLMHKAIEEDPNNVEYRILYAQYLVMQNHYTHAHGVATTVLEKFNGNNLAAKKVLLELALRELRHEDALQIVADIYSGLNANDPMGHYYRAHIYSQLGRYADATREIDLMEAAASKGAVLSLVYTALTESDWTPATSVRRLHEHIMSLQREGWILIPATKIPSLLKPEEGKQRPTSVADEVPATARMIDYLIWCFTGKRRFAKKDKSDDDDLSKPKKYFTILFDGDLRSSLLLGNEVAEDFGVPFSIFVPTAPSKDYVPSRAGWDELRKYAATGNWIVGSHLHASFEKQAVDKDGKDLRAPLPNRIWLKERNRVESMSEWDKRIRHEFRDSRNALRLEMGENDTDVPLVSYPFSDIGEEGACNLHSIRDPAATLVAEAARSYQVGFVQTPSGYTVFGDNLLLCRTYAPNWTDEGSDLVRHAYDNHPLFIARKMRAEIAMLRNHPNEANNMLAALRRDGYPEDLCREVERAIHSHFQNKSRRDRPPLVTEESYMDDTTNVVIASETHEGRGEPLISLDHPYVGPIVFHSKANDQIETFGLGLRAGLDITKNTTLGFEYTDSKMEQTVRPRWNAVIVTNVPYSKSKYKFKMQTKSLQGTLTHRLENGTVLSASIGKKSKKRLSTNSKLTDINLQDDLNSHEFTLDGDDDIITAVVGAMWNPTDNLRLHFIYDHDYVPSAVKNVDYHGFLGNVKWKPEDSWNVEAQVQYRTYSDDNAFYHAFLESMWQTSTESGIWAGLRLATVSVSEPCDFYWTPYWDQRVLGVLRYTQHREGYNFTFDILCGIHQEEGRPDRRYEMEVTREKTVMVDGVANTVEETATDYYVMEPGGSGWHKIWGFGGAYGRNLTSMLTINIEGQVMALRDYIDHSVLVYLRLRF